MSKKISTHQRTINDQVRSVFGNARAYASNTGNQPILRAVEELAVLEQPSAAQIDSVIALTEAFIKANQAFAASTKAEAAAYREQNDLDDGEAVNRAEARTYSGEPFNTAATQVRAALAAVKVLVTANLPELA